MDDAPLLKGLRDLNVKLHDENNILYKYASLETAKLILNNQTMYFQTAINFNDPFELHLGFIEPKKDYINDFLAFIKKKNLYNPELEEELRTIGDEEMAMALIQALINCRSTYGIMCLSKKNDNTLMWSHYADKHKGVCIGFRVPTLSGPTITVEVKYVDEIKSLEHSFVTSASTVHWMCTKSKIWEYEEEVRMIDITHNGIFPFAKFCLCEIYFGMATPQEEIEALKSIIKQKGYPVSRAGKMFINKDDFKLAIETRTIE
jgi:hypothetical protein